jgi:hypothetical protein
VNYGVRRFRDVKKGAVGMNVLEMRSVVQAVEPDRLDQTGIVIEFVKDDGKRSPIILKVASRTGVDLEVRGPIVVEDRTAECEAFAEWVAKLVNAEVDRLKSLLLSKLIEDWFRRFPDKRYTWIHGRVCGLVSCLNIVYGVTTICGYTYLLDKSKPFRLGLHNGGIVRLNGKM